MKVILEPKVTVVAATQFFGHPDYPIPPDGTDAERLGAFAAKSCYDSFGENGRANTLNQKNVIEHRHGSVLEHPNISIFVEGFSRAGSLESNRHRQFAVSQRSTRYTKEEESAIVLEPYYAELYRKFEPSHDLCRLVHDPESEREELEWKVLLEMLLASKVAISSYIEQVKMLEQLNPNNLTGFDLRKWARGKARNILPHALETRITYTGNYRAMRWFIEARSDRHAEPEIRRLADAVLTAIRPYAPTYFEDMELVAVIDGIPEWKPTYSKV